jgi:hypothetical protein
MIPVARSIILGVPMTSVRRHLASLGLVMMVCTVVMQVLVPAALCCHQATTVAKAAKRAPARDCCPAGSHSGQVCPLHGAKRASTQAGASDCGAGSQQDFGDLLVVLNAGGVLPSPVRVAVPTGSERALVAAQPQTLVVTDVPPGPPPRA